MIVACVAAGAIVGAYRLWSIKPEYVASARLYVEPTDVMGHTEPSLTDGKAATAWSPPTDLLFGAEIGSAAAQAGNLQSLASFAGVPDLPRQIVSKLDVKTQPAQSGPGQIQDLRLRWSEPKAAERALESVITAYGIMAERWRSQRIDESLVALEGQRKLLLDRLQQKQAELQSFKETNPSAFRASDSLVLDGRLKALVDSRIRAEIRRIEAEVRLAALRGVASVESGSGGRRSQPESSPADTAFDRALLDSLFSSFEAEATAPEAPKFARRSRGDAGNGSGMVKANAEGAAATDRAALPEMPPAQDGDDLETAARYVQRLEETWGPEHPKLQAAKTRLADLERRARGETGRLLRMAEAQYRFCRDEEEGLQRAIDAQRALTSAGHGGDSAVQAQILQQVVDRSGKLLASVCERIDRLSLESASAGIAGVRITTVMPPNAALLTTSDQTPKLFLVPVGIGLLIGFALTYLRESKSAPVTRGRATENHARPVSARKDTVLGWVPALPREGGRGSERAMGTWVLRESDSKAAKAFRRLAEQVSRAAGRSDASCVLVSSAQPQEGKSVVLANMATAMAQKGRKVLLIDANYDHPSQHVLLSDILSLTLGDGSADAAGEISVEAFERGRVAMRTQLETLWVVPAWPKPACPTEILESAALREFIRLSRTQYDLILIDGPSLTDRSEIELLAELADAVVYVADVANAPEPVQRKTRSRLGVPSIGFIMNAVPPAGAGRSDGTAATKSRRASGTPAASLPPDRGPQPVPEAEPEEAVVGSGPGESDASSESSY